SHANGLPVLVITAYGALMIVYRSGIKWNMASSLMFLSMFGWVSGVVPAILDSAIIVNNVMHNTKWVPGHFHLYMGLGVVAMIFGFMYYLGINDSNLKSTILDKVALVMFTVAILGVSGSFLTSGALSVPRRFATHLPEWMGPALFGGISGIFAILATIIFVIYFICFFIKRSNITVQPMQDTKIS